MYYNSKTLSFVFIYLEFCCIGCFCLLVFVVCVFLIKHQNYKDCANSLKGNILYNGMLSLKNIHVFVFPQEMGNVIVLCLKNFPTPEKM